MIEKDKVISKFMQTGCVLDDGQQSFTIPKLPPFVKESQIVAYEI